VASGQLSRSDHVFQDGGTEWLIVGNVPQLAGGGGAPVIAVQGAAIGGGNRVFCRGCGSAIHNQAVICPQCGVATGGQTGVPSGKAGVNRAGGQKDKMVAVLLAFFLGGLGVHRFYLGDTGLGVLHLLTCGICGIGALVDFIVLLAMNQAAFDQKYNS